MQRVPIAIVPALLAAAPAQAATPVVVERPGAVACSQAGPADVGRRGVGAVRHVPRSGGVVQVRLRAGSGDWDLAVVDARSGHRHGASASSGPREQVLAAATAGRPLLAVACRRSGGSRRARVGFFPHRAALADRSFPARLVRVPLAGAAALERLEATGLDVTHNANPAYADVVVYSAAELARLTAAGFTARTRIADLRAATARTLRRPAATPLPSGQATYRTLAEYGEQLKRIVADHPAIARMVVAGGSIEGRPVEGVELATDVHAGDDGRPVFLVLGLHHAREWPSGEMPMEFAIELAKLHAAGDPRVNALLARVRVIAIPVVNPDGFEVSRSAGPMPGDDDPFTTLPLIVTDSAAYKRKNCRPAAGSEEVPCATRPTLQGVDLNRNYGAFWGGVGSSSEPAHQTYRGEAPFSEPESEAIHRLSSTRVITNVISHHTFTDEGVWLRQPGFCDDDGCSGDDDVVPDEAAMRDLGDAMGSVTGWRSALAWDIGQITGATEDWNYFTQGAYGYTPEQRGVNFHPDFEDAVVREYTGEDAGGAGGVREALLRAAELAADPAHHGVLEGSAPAGRILRLRKAFDTATSQPGVVVKDALDFRLTVPAGGRFEWHVNPSTRPLATAPEAYVLTCEAPDGTVLEQRHVVVARGARVPVDLRCAAAEAQPPDATLRPRLSARVGTLSARRINARRGLTLRVRTTGRVTALSVRLVRGKRTVARGRLRELSGGRSLRLRRIARVRSGRHRLVIGARAGGRRVTASRAVRVRR